jgi:hypothetical protein
MRRSLLLAAFVCFALGAFDNYAAAQTFPYDHIHVNAPDPAAAANWYEKYFGGRRITEAPDRLMFGWRKDRTRRTTRNQAGRVGHFQGVFIAHNTFPHLRSLQVQNTGRVGRNLLRN